MNDGIINSYINVLRSASRNDAKKLLKRLLVSSNRKPIVSENRMRRVIGMPGVFRDKRTGILYEFNANSGRFITFQRQRRRTRSGSTSSSERQLLELLGRRRRSFL